MEQLPPLQSREDYRRGKTVRERKSGTMLGELHFLGMAEATPIKFSQHDCLSMC